MQQFLFVTDKWTDGWKIIEGETTDIITKMMIHIHTYEQNLYQYRLGLLVDLSQKQPLRAVLQGVVESTPPMISK